MISNHAKHTILVPIVNDDISEVTYETAIDLLKSPDSQLVLLHVARPDDGAHASRGAGSTVTEPRWHKLARALPAGRTFIDAVADDSASAIAAEAERFHSDAVLL